VRAWLAIPLILVSAAAPPFVAGEAPSAPTARQVVERIKARVGVPWTDPTVDTFKAGDPDTPVTGVATTMMATLDVLQRAAAAGANLVITHEPTFFNHLDETATFESARDPVYLAKQAFIREHHMVVWRFHDYWHRRAPDGIREGVVAALGWDRYRVAGDPLLFVLPPTPLAALGKDVKARLGVDAMRIVGPPDLVVSRVALLPGAWGFAEHLKVLPRADVDAVFIGEAQEWETIEYVVDAVAAGMRKALIVPGHVPSEQPGMEECARWLRTFVTDVPVQFVPTREPWTDVH
jgi:putative NIF3 family GTP cyclohydrolase 1 type 2